MTDEIIWAGAEALREHIVPIGTLTRHPKNPRQGDVDEIAKSLARWGQVRMVLVDDTDTVIAGNHTLLAAESLGWTHIAKVLNTFSSVAEAEAYLLADNRLGDLGEYDRAELTLLLGELAEHGRWDGTGYDADDLDHYRALEAAANTPPPEEIPPPPVAPQAPPGMREVVLLFDEEQQATFGTNVRALRARYGLEGVTDTVLRALHDEALRVNQGTA